MSEVVRVIEAAATLSQSEVSTTATISTSDTNVDATVSSTDLNPSTSVTSEVVVVVGVPQTTGNDNKFLAYTNGQMVWVNIEDLFTAYFKDHNIDYLLSLNEVES